MGALTRNSVCARAFRRSFRFCASSSLWFGGSDGRGAGWLAAVHRGEGERSAATACLGVVFVLPLGHCSSHALGRLLIAVHHAGAGTPAAAAPQPVAQAGQQHGAAAHCVREEARRHQVSGRASCTSTSLRPRPLLLSLVGRTLGTERAATSASSTEHNTCLSFPPSPAATHVPRPGQQ